MNKFEIRLPLIAINLFFIIDLKTLLTAGKLES